MKTPLNIKPEIKPEAATTGGESFAEVFAREGIMPVGGIAGGLAGADNRHAAPVLPPDGGEDLQFAEQKLSIAGGADKRRLLNMRKQPPEESLDLHGLTAKEAHAAVDNFLRAQMAAGRRHVEIIHGKGGEMPVLRAKTRKWLAGCAAVLGYAEAPNNGGAVRVMLRRGR